MPEYYALFGLAPKLNFDLKDLERRFYALSRKLHPDMHPLDQQQALDATAELNDAYRTLRDPIRRAEYLLRQNGFDIGEQGSKNVPPELLEEVFELNMALENSPSRDDLEDARGKFTGFRDEVDQELAAKFDEYDRSGEKSVLADIRGLLNRRRYIRNLVNQVEQELAAA